MHERVLAVCNPDIEGARLPLLGKGGVSRLVWIKPRSRLSASQWQSVDREYTSNILWNIRNAVR
eukprot:1195414-Prorocentrum_minimum.AAC.11